MDEAYEAGMSALRAATVCMYSAMVGSFQAMSGIPATQIPKKDRETIVHTAVDEVRRQITPGSKAMANFELFAKEFIAVNLNR